MKAMDPPPKKNAHMYSENLALTSSGIMDLHPQTSRGAIIPGQESLI